MIEQNDLVMLFWIAVVLCNKISEASTTSFKKTEFPFTWDHAD